MNKYRVDGTCVFLPNVAGGFNVSHCPDSANLARRIGASLNTCARMNIDVLEIAGSNGPDAKEWFEGEGRAHVLLTALKEFGRHLPGCELSEGNLNAGDEPQCSCGLSKAIFDAIG
jgi:hypothetical protein